MKKYHVYGIGNALVDMEFKVDDDFLSTMSLDKGMMTLVDKTQHHTLLGALAGGWSKRASGGSAANSMVTLNYFGGKTFYACKVASDETGDFYVHDLEAAGVATNLASHRDPGITGKCLVMITPDAERTMATYLGITQNLSTNEVTAETIRDADYIYLEGYLVTSATARQATLEAKAIAEQHGIKTALSFSDPSIVQFFKPGLEAMVGRGVDLLFCNQEEALTWTNSTNVHDAITGLKTVAKTFALTLGSRGVIIYDGENLIEIEPHTVDAIDTTGAGDSFAGAFLYGITHGFSYQKAGELANFTAAQLVTHYGPRMQPKDYRAILEYAVT